MANEDVMAVDQRLAQLEQTVAKGFFDQGQRLNRLEDRIEAVAKTAATGFSDQGERMNRLEDRIGEVDSKLDIVAESIRGDLKTVLEAVTAGTDEMRRTTDAIRKEHEADRQVTRSILKDHSARIRELERSNPEPLEPR